MFNIIHGIINLGGFWMAEFEKIDDTLYKAEYINHDSKETLEIWNKIRNNKLLLEWAIKLTKDKFGQRDLVNGLSICDLMLVDYENVDKDVYNELIKLIYSNEQIARIVLDGASNGGYSFLLMSLWNHGLKLTNEQKEFAEKEAMLKIGTKYWKQKEEEYSSELDKIGVTDDSTTLINIGGSINPIGKKSKAEYMRFMFSSLSDSQAHGVGDYDIRYCILNNPNWTIDEKQKLIFDFWQNDEEYDEQLEQWEWGVINDAPNDSNGEVSLDISELNYYQYNDLLNIFNNESIATTVWQNIQFCRLMHKLRPAQWEIEKGKPKQLLKK
jgi:hypothetical protein